MRSSTGGAYDGVQKTLHWLTAILVAAQFVVAWTMSEPPKGQPPVGLMNLHLSIGATILVVTVLRLLWRATHPVSAQPRDIPAWQQIAARATHLGFYAILIVMPLAGWAWASAKAWLVTLFGAVALSPLALGRTMSGDVAASVHEALGTVLLILIAVHVAAALRHRFVLKDDTLARMLPGSTRDRGA